MARAPRTARGGRRLQGRSAGRGRRSATPKRKGLKRIGIVDTSFSRYDMASAAIHELRKQGGGFVIERYTVPGIKDLAAGARILFDRGCDLVLALGMVGRQPVDKDRKSTRLNSSHVSISYAVFCLKKKNKLYGVLLLHVKNNYKIIYIILVCMI